MGFSILSETLCCGFQFFARWTAASISICLSTALLVSENIDVKVLFTILKKWKFCPCIYLFICLSVCPSVITPYSFPFLSDSKLRRVTQPLPRYIMSPSMSPMPAPTPQSTGPPSQSQNVYFTELCCKTVSFTRF